MKKKIKKHNNPFAFILQNPLFKMKKIRNKKGKCSYTRKTKHKNTTLISIIVLSVFILASCSSTPLIQTKTIIKTPDIIHPADPIPPQIIDFEVIVVNREELEKLINNTEDNFAYFMLSPEGYEVVIKNMNELRRYIENQKQIILYYRKILKKEDD